MLEVAIEEARAINPDVVVQSCTAAMSAKDCLELTQHAQESGADIVYIQTPMMEAARRRRGAEVLPLHQPIAPTSRSACSIRRRRATCSTPRKARGSSSEIPAVCATKEGAFRPANSRRLHDLAPDLVIWECDTTVYRAGWLRDGHRRAGATGHDRVPPRDAAAPRLHRVLEPDLERQVGRGDGLRRAVRDSTSSTSDMAGRGSPAIRAARITSRTGAARSSTRPLCSACRSGITRSRGRRKPTLPEEAKAQIREAYQRFGLIDS